MDLNKEAAVVITSITGLVTAVIGLAVAFGAPISDAQRDSILGTVAAFFVVIVTIGPIIRQFVWSKNSVEKAVTVAYEATPGVDPKPKV